MPQDDAFRFTEYEPDDLVLAACGHWWPEEACRWFRDSRGIGLWQLCPNCPDWQPLKTYHVYFEVTYNFRETVNAPNSAEAEIIARKFVDEYINLPGSMPYNIRVTGVNLK